MALYHCPSCGHSISPTEASCANCGASTAHFRSRQKRLEDARKKVIVTQSRTVTWSVLILLALLVALYFVTQSYASAFAQIMKLVAAVLLIAAEYGVVNYLRRPTCPKCGHRGPSRFKHLAYDGSKDPRFRSNELVCGKCKTPIVVE